MSSQSGGMLCLQELKFIIILFRDETFLHPSFPNKRYGKVLSVNLIERLY